jgi:hypothetical protein
LSTRPETTRVELGGTKWQVLGIGLPQVGAGVVQPVAGEIEKAGRRIDPGKAIGCGAFGDRLGQGTGATSDVQPIEPGGGAEPSEEFTRHQPAPTPDIRLVDLAARPAMLHLIGHRTSPPKLAPGAAGRREEH